jgi:hypothetical protein
MAPKNKRQNPEEVVEEESLADIFANETEEAESLADLAGTGSGGMFEGDLLKMEDIEDKKHYVLDFVQRPSEFPAPGRENYVCIQIKRKDGTLNVVNSTATVIMKIVNADKSKFPALNAFVKRTPKGGGKQYWDFAGKKEFEDLEWL